jgi:hypothetical protein
MYGSMLDGGFDEMEKMFLDQSIFCSDGADQKSEKLETPEPQPLSLFSIPQKQITPIRAPAKSTLTSIQEGDSGPSVKSF